MKRNEPNQPAQPASRAGEQNHQTITGSVERVTFHNEENGYSVLRFYAQGQAEPITVIGNFSAVSPGESLRLTGWWTTHPQYGDQFKVVDYAVTRPATVAGIQKYLGSGLIKGVGPITARRIVEHFGERTLEVIEGDISRLSEVKGVSRKRIEMIRKTWEEQRAIKDVMLFLQSHSVSTHFAVKIYKQYGNDSISVVEKTPYRLAAEVYGIGFKTADQIARNLGMPVDAEERLRAGLQYVLSAATEEGHCYLPAHDLIKRSADALEVKDEARLDTSLGKMLDDGLLKTEEIEQEQAIYLPPLWQAERGIARRVKALVEKPVRIDAKRVESWLDRFTAKRGIELSAEQRQAIHRAAGNHILILTGGPGTGKTLSLRAMVELFQAMGKEVALASPTGRAAQRLSEVTGREAKTIHRLLDFDPTTMQFKRNDVWPLDADVVIVDEASMIDVVLANSLLKAVDERSQLILVGDVDQLPSVGPGAVLKDLINSGVVPVARLTQIFRQAAESLIIQNAHRINRGEFPLLVKPGEQRSDCYFIEAEEPHEIVDLIVNSVARSLPKSFGYDPLKDIQVLSPMNRGRVGANHLNDELQAALNPPGVAGVAGAGKTEMNRGSRVLRAGDKVIQRVNNYKLEVFNGDLGTIEAIDLEDQMVAVRFADRLVSYDYGDLLELGHGFCVSVHKCVAAGTWLFTEHGLQPIENFWPAGNGLCHQQLRLKVKGRDGWTECSQIYKGEEESVITIKTNYGYSLSGSFRHPILVFDSVPGELVWKKLPEIKYGDLIPIQRGQYAFPSSQLSTADFCVQDRPIGNRQPCRIPTMVTRELGAFLGYLVGDGSYTSRKDGDIRFTNSDQRLVEDFHCLIRELFGLEMKLNRSTANHRTQTWYLVNRTLRDFLLYLGLDYSSAGCKEVPHAILRSPREVQAAFLRSLFDCDGSASGNGTRVVLATASARLAEQVQMMLLNFGIISRVITNRIRTPVHGDRDYYRVEFYGRNLMLFAQEIGFSQEHKAEQLKAMIHRTENGSGKTNIDVIPNGRKLIQSLRSDVTGLLPAIKSTQGRKGEGFWGRLPYQPARAFDDLCRGRFRLNYYHLDFLLPILHKEWPELEDADSYRRLFALQNSRFFFDTVAEITQGQGVVYDLTVPGAENFTTNGFISHNSQGSEYPAVVIPLHTQHYLMLSRNLLYTALTRAKKTVVIIGTTKAIGMAMSNMEATHRFTGLSKELKD